MAHGSPRIDICRKCHHYTLVSRFSEDPKCPTCGKKAEQTTKEKIRVEYGLSLFHDWYLGFNFWTKLPKIKR